MKTVTITVSINGNEVSRNYIDREENNNYTTWGVRVMDMLDTIEKSKEF